MFVLPQIKAGAGFCHENVVFEVCDVTAVPGTVGTTKMNQPV